MSQRYSVYVTLDAAFDYDTIKVILNKGLRLGYSFDKLIWLGQIADGKGFEVEGLPLTIDEIIAGLETAEKKNSVFSVNVTLKGSYTDILFVSLNGKISIVFSGLSPMWSRIDFDGEEEINIQRYALTLLNIVNEYKVLKVSIQKD